MAAYMAYLRDSIAYLSGWRPEITALNICSTALVVLHCRSQKRLTPDVDSIELREWATRRQLVRDLRRRISDRQLGDR